MLHRLNLLLLGLLVLFGSGVVGYLYLDTAREETLLVAGGSRTSEGFQLLEAIAVVVHRHHPNIRLDVVETAGSLDNSQLIDRGHADLAAIQADGNTSKTGHLIANLYPDSYQLIARRDSHIRSVSDLRGKVIALPSKGSAQFSSFWFLAGHFGLSESTLTALPMSNRAAEWALISGAVDAVFRVRAPGDNSIKQLVRRADITLIPVDQAQALHLRHSTIRPGMIPKGSYRGSPPVPISDLPTASVNRMLVAAESVPADVVYAITEVLFERRRELSELSSLASLTSAPDRYAGTHLPLHEGAESYYDREEPGIWSEQADFLRTLISLVAIFGSMTFAFRNWFQGRQKDRADAHNKNLVDLYEQACLQEFSTDHYQRELANILTQVVDDLDNDRISNEGFDEFSFTWQAVSQLISNVPTHGSEVGHAEDAGAAK